MSHILVERAFPEPRTLEDMIDKAPAPGHGCFGLYMVIFRVSFLATDGSRAVCCFEAPDADSVRTPLRSMGVDVSMLWSGNTHDAPALDQATIASANVLVERSFAQPVPFESIAALAKANASCLELHGAEFMRSYFARDGKRMLCLYRAPDAESVRSAQRAAQMPFDRVWAFDPVWPKNAASRTSAVRAS